MKRRTNATAGWVGFGWVGLGSVGLGSVCFGLVWTGWVWLGLVGGWLGWDSVRARRSFRAEKTGNAQKRAREKRKVS